MKTIQDYSLQLSVSDLAYSSKKDINWSKVTYSTSTINLNLFTLLIKSGYCFCYNFNQDHLSQSDKTLKNWSNTSAIFIDIDDANVCMNEFLENLTFAPTIAYTTFSNNIEENKFRYRLIYCFDKIINDIDLYKKLYFSIINKLEEENNFKNKDNCAQSPAQQFAGSNSECNMNITYNIFSFNDFLNNNLLNNNIEIRSNTNNERVILNNNKKRENIMYYNDPFENIEYIKDYWEQSYEYLLKKYNTIYPFFTHTELPEVSEDIPYIILPDNYIEIQRNWGITDFIKDNNDVILFSKIRKIKDGEKRKYKLFINGILRRFMKPDITFEYLLHMLINELYYFIDNRNDKITKKTLYQIAKNIHKANLDEYQELNKKNVSKKFIVNDEYCIKYNLSRAQARNIAKKEINYQKIGEMYDYSLTDKENSEVMKQYGLTVSERTIKRFRKENNITKYKAHRDTLKENDTTIVELKDNAGNELEIALNDENNYENTNDMNKERIINRLEKWKDFQTKEELIKAWQSAKLYIANNAESFDERKEFDYLLENYYWNANKTITA